MTKQREDTLDRIVQTQEAMRKSIDEARRLANETERLVEQHRKELDRNTRGG